MTARFSLLLRNTRGHRPRLQYHQPALSLF